jgi:hypothetical protein
VPSALNPTGVPSRDGDGSEREELRLFAVPKTSSILIEITSASTLNETAAFYPLARFLAEHGEQNVTGVLVDRARGAGVRRDTVVQLTPSTSVRLHSSCSVISETGI